MNLVYSEGEFTLAQLRGVLMSRSLIPKYRHHTSGSAYVYHRSIDTSDHRLSLGKYNTPESLRRYRQFLKRLEIYQAGQEMPLIGSVPNILELVVAYIEYAKQHYKRIDSQGNQFTAQEYGEMRYALRIVLDLYGDDIASEFGPRCLKTVQRWMVKEKYARSHINHTTSRIKRFFRWAASEELIPSENYHKLLCVRGLQRGEQGVRETKKVRPACPESLAAVLKFLPPTVADMAQLQYFCGMRPGEVCIMRPMDIDTKGTVWWYCPESHKNLWRDQSLVKPVPRVAQKLLSPYLEKSAEEYLFDPRAAYAWSMTQRPERKTPVYPSEQRRVEREKRLRRRRIKRNEPGQHYTTDSYRRAISRGFDRAEASDVEVVRFSPNQLRHAIATYISANVSAQAAQRWAGHESLQTTGIYIEKQKSELEAIEHALHERWIEE